MNSSASGGAPIDSSSRQDSKWCRQWVSMSFPFPWSIRSPVAPGTAWATSTARDGDARRRLDRLDRDAAVAARHFLQERDVLARGLARAARFGARFAADVAVGA